MKKRLIINDIKRNKLVSLATICFMAISAMLIGLSVLLFSSLLNSIDSLMETAKTPDFLQMHSGEINEEELKSFVLLHDEVDQMQICTFLNLENGEITINEHSLDENNQDNGLAIQNPNFDLLVDLEGKQIEVESGTVYVPVCYRSEYEVQVGDVMQIGTAKLVVAGFLRDSQMNSMMASSKRFLVTAGDYQKLSELGQEEYLIEFKLKAGADVNKFATAYSDAGLPSNGPTITYQLVKMMNALSDGMMILIILLVSVVVLAISILCIHYIILTGLEKDKKEIGMLKAVGIAKKEIRSLYFSKFVFLSIIGALFGMLGAFVAYVPMAQQMKELYGMPENMATNYIISILGTLLVEGIILLSVRNTLKKMEKLTAVEALLGNGRFERKKNRYLFISVITAAAVALMLIPQNMANTLSAPEFVTYMGIGSSQIRIDVRQSEQIEELTNQVMQELQSDESVEDAVVMTTKSYRAVLSDGNKYNLLIENGDHGKYPVNYDQGTYPKQEGEIAFSILNAEELGISLGDTITIQMDQEDSSSVRTCRVCGIYSDITNGGKTAKAQFDLSKDTTPVMWSIIYVNVKDSISVTEWTSSFSKKAESIGAGIQVTDISKYVLSTYGQTIRNIKDAALLAMLTATVVLFIVVILFMRLTLWQERRDCSLKKALGYTAKELTWAYMVKAMAYILAGIIVGIFWGLVPGQGMAGMLLGNLGASGFHFIINPIVVFAGIPLLTLAVGTLAIQISLREMKKIRAYECCVGRE